jgi:hypothetical protein
MLSARANTDLVQRAAAIALHSARLIARSIETVRRSAEIVQSVTRHCERAGIARTERLRRQARSDPPAAEHANARQTEHVLTLPLTPPRLLELAREFCALADNAVTWEVRVAFQDLVFRYTALAAGYDTRRIGTCRLH